MTRRKSRGVAAEMAAIEAKLKAAQPKRKAGFSSWSFTKYVDHKRCPLYAKLRHLDKVEEPKGPALERGSDIDRLAELYVKSDGRGKLPEALGKFRKEFAALAARHRKDPRSLVLQDSWAFRKDWTKTTWNDWDGCAVRLKVDVAWREGRTRLELVDWKTGKYRAERREEYVEQLELYALAALLQIPELQEVRARLGYLDVGVWFPEAGSPDEARLVFVRDDVPRLKKLWDRRTRAMLLDRSFVPRPNALCSWCWYGRSKKGEGGPGLCRY